MYQIEIFIHLEERKKCNFTQLLGFFGDHGRFIRFGTVSHIYIPPRLNLIDKLVRLQFRFPVFKGLKILIFSSMTHMIINNQSWEHIF